MLSLSKAAAAAAPLKQRHANANVVVESAIKTDAGQQQAVNQAQPLLHCTANAAAASASNENANATTTTNTQGCSLLSPYSAAVDVSLLHVAAAAISSAAPNGCCGGGGGGGTYERQCHSNVR